MWRLWSVSLTVVTATLALVDLSQDAVERDKVQTIDFNEKFASLLFGACAEVLGEEGAGWSAVETLMNRAAVMFAWGLTRHCRYRARSGARVRPGRFAFGRSIASYQAIKHKLAKMYVKNTLARSNAYYGAWALNADSKDLGVARHCAGFRDSGVIVCRGREYPDAWRYGLHLGVRLPVLSPCEAVEPRGRQ